MQSWFAPQQSSPQMRSAVQQWSRWQVWLLVQQARGLPHKLSLAQQAPATQVSFSSQQALPQVRLFGQHAPARQVWLLPQHLPAQRLVLAQHRPSTQV
jgi:hypothetical protein